MRVLNLKSAAVNHWPPKQYEGLGPLGPNMGRKPWASGYGYILGINKFESHHSGPQIDRSRFQCILSGDLL